MFETHGIGSRARLWVALLFLCASRAGLARADEADDAELEGVQELILTRSTRLQMPGELQITVGCDRVEGPRGWSSELESELGITRWFQVGVGTTLLAPDGESDELELAAMLSPPLGAGEWRFAIGANRRWALTSDDEEATSELALLASRCTSAVEFVFAAALRQQGLAPLLGLAAVLGGGPWFPILELSTDLEASETTLSPGLAWHAPRGLEVSAGTPLVVRNGRIVPSGAIRLSKEWALVE